MTIAMKALLAFVGALTLGIGGVGLANIMLASVIDRTREIGTMQALGAYRRMILRQFFVCGDAVDVRVACSTLVRRRTWSALNLSPADWYSQASTLCSIATPCASGA